jgi:hypothetical protein
MHCLARARRPISAIVDRACGAWILASVQLNLALHLLKRQVDARVIFTGLRLDGRRTPIQFAIPLLADRSGLKIPA